MKQRMTFSFLIISVFLLSSISLQQVEAVPTQDIDTGIVSPTSPDDQDAITFRATGNGDVSTITITVYYRKSTTSVWTSRNLNLFGDCFLDPDLGSVCVWSGATGIAPLSAGAYFYYFSGASDREPVTGSKSFVVSSTGDSTPPSISGISIIPTNPSQSDPVRVIADVTDASTIQIVEVEWTSPVGSGRRQMINTIESVYEYNSIPNYPAKTAVNYRIHAKDNWGNIGISNWQGYLIADTEPPKIENVRLIPTPPNDEVPTIVEARVTDIANTVNVVRITVFKDSIHQGDYNMIRMGSLFQYDFGMASSGTLFRYEIRATDSVGNTATHFAPSFLIATGSPPTVTIQPTNPVEPGESQDTTVSARIVDGSGISSVTANYGRSGSESISIILTQIGDIWSGVVPGQSYGTTVTYTFNAVDNTGQQNSAFSNYAVTDNDGPTIENIDHAPSVPRPNEEISVTASISDTNGLSNIILEHSIDGGTSYTNLTMTVDPILGIPYYNASFISALDWNINLFYRIFASDSLGNWAVTSLIQITISDTIAPSITSVSHTPTNPSNASTVIVTGTVTDSKSGVDVVLLLYTFDNSTWFSIEMGGVLSVYSASIPNRPWDSYIEYRIQANDSLGNLILSNVESYRVEDTASPSITSIGHSPISPYNDSIVTVSAEINDDVSGVDYAELLFTIDNSTWTIVPMSGVSSTFSADIPSQDWYTVVTFKIIAYDLLENFASSSNRSYSVEDNSLPDITLLNIPADLTPDDDLIFRIQATDGGSGINRVLLYYKIDNNNYIFVEMTLENADNFAFTVSPQPWGTVLEYYFYAEDLSGNSITTTPDTIVVQDIIAPTISNIQSTPTTPTNLEIVVISSSITDDKTEIQSAILFYSLDNQQTWSTLIMSNIGLSTYNASIPAQSWDSSVYYFVEAIDSFGNGRNSSLNMYTVVDVFKPIIQSVERQPLGVDTSIEVLINASTFDEGVGMDYVELHYQLDSNGWNIVLMPNSLGINYLYLIPGQTSNTVVEYFVRSFDILGNFETSITYSYLVGDSVSPTISSINHSPGSPYEEDNVVISTTIVDYGSGVETAFVVYSINNGSDWTFVTMISFENNTYSAIIQKQIWNTTVIYYISATDYLSNTQDSDQYQYVVRESGLPSISNIIRSPQAPKQNDDIQFWAIVTDSKSGISSVRLEYSYTSGGSGSVLMTLVGENNYTGIIPAANADARVYYTIRVYDNDGNTRYSGGSFVTADNIPPRITSITILEVPNNNESTAIAVSASDAESFLSAIYVYYSLDNETWYVESDQYGDYKEIYYGRFVLVPPQSYTDIVYYFVSAIDGYGNVANSSIMSYFVEDGTPPNIIKLTRTPDQPQQNESLLIEIEVIDIDTGINSVEIFYMFNNTEIWNSSIMVQGIEGNYSYLFSPQPYGSNLFYYIVIRDNSPLQIEVRSLMKSVLFIDYWGPSITDISQIPLNGAISNNDTVSIQASITDSQGVYSATLQYFVNGDYKVISMLRGSGDLWFGEIGSYPVGTNVTYRIYALDNPRCYFVYNPFGYICPTKNSGFSQYQTYFVTLDDLPPVISNFRHTPTDNISNEDTIEIFIDIEDVGVGVQFRALYLDFSDYYLLAQVNETTYTATISGLTYGHNYTVSITSEDYNRYKSQATYYFLVTVDGISPTITNMALSNDPVYEVSNAMINATITDRGSGLQLVTLFYSTNGSTEWLPISMIYSSSNSYYAIIPSFSWDWTISYYIVAVDNFENNSTSSIKSYHILEKDNPLLLQILHDPITPSNKDTIVIIIQASDDKSGISSVSIFVSIANNEYVNFPHVFNGTHYIVILGILDFNTTVSYYASVVDIDGNEVISDMDLFTVIDRIDPLLISVERVPNIVYNTESVSVRINTSDVDSGISSVVLYYQLEGNSPIEVIAQFQGNLFQAEIPIQVYNQLVYYYVIIYDNQGNSVSSSTFSYTVDDAIAPTIHEVIQYPITVTYTDEITIRANISDIGSGIDEVWLSYSVETVNYNIEMILSGDYYEAILPVLSYSTWVKYHVTAIDVNGLRSNSSDYTYIVEDTSHPIIYSVSQTPQQVEYNDQVTIYANISDIGSGISNVYLHYTVDNGVTLTNIMVMIDGVYETTIPVHLFNSIIKYSIEVVDVAGLITNSSNYSYIIEDLSHPIIYSVSQTPQLVDYIDLVAVSANVSDAGSGISVVYLHYTVDNGITFTEVMALNGSIYEITIPAQLFNSVINYYIEAVDVSGFVTNSALIEYTIGDQVDPVILSVIMLDSSVDSTESPLVKVTADDIGSGVSSVVIFYKQDGGAWSSFQLIFSTNEFLGNIPTMPTGAVVEYFVEVTDNVGNSVTSPIYSFIVVEATTSTVSTETTTSTTSTETTTSTTSTETTTSTTSTETNNPTTNSDTSIQSTSTLTSGSTDIDTSDSPFSSLLILIMSIIGFTQLIRMLRKKKF